MLLALRTAKTVKGIHAVTWTTKNEWKQNYTALTKTKQNKHTSKRTANNAQYSTAKYCNY